MNREQHYNYAKTQAERSNKGLLKRRTEDETDREERANCSGSSGSLALDDVSAATEVASIPHPYFKSIPPVTLNVPKQKSTMTAYASS